METLEEKLEALSQNKRASKAVSIAFVENYDARMQSINCPISLISEAYYKILDNMDDAAGFFRKFSTTGLDICDRELSSGGTTISASPHVFSVIKNACNRLGIEVDMPIPDTVSARVGYSTDTYLFLWDTVPVEWLTSLQKKWLINNLVDTDMVREVYTGDVYTARKYQNLMNSAESRHIDFTITFNDLKEVLDKETCYFTGVQLVSFEHDSSKVRSGELTLPYNYRTIDRLDNTKGYVPGNIVACTKVINEIKGEYSLDKFKEILEEVEHIKDKYSGREVSTIKRLL